MLQDMDKKIVLVTHEITNTGAPTLLRKIAARLKSAGWYVVILSIRKTEITPEYRQCCDELIMVDEINSLSGKVLKRLKADVEARNAKVLEKTIKRLSRRGFDKVIVNTMVSGITVEIFYKYNFKIVTLVHEMGGACRMFSGGNRVKNIAEYSQHVVFPADIVKAEFMKLAGNINGKVHIRPQGVYKKNVGEICKEQSRLEIAKRLSLPDNSRFVVGSGTVAYIKGVDIAFMIAKELEDRENLYFIWMGDIPEDFYTPNLMGQWERMNLQDKFHFTGYITDASLYNTIMQGSECFILTSREDSYPSVMAEAITSRLPVIAFKDSGGANELLADGRGQLVEYMNVKMFAQAICNVVDGRINVDEEVALSQKYVDENLDFDKYVDDLLAYFE